MRPVRNGRLYTTALLATQATKECKALADAMVQAILSHSGQWKAILSILHVGRLPASWCRNRVVCHWLCQCTWNFSQNHDKP